MKFPALTKTSLIRISVILVMAALMSWVFSDQSGELHPVAPGMIWKHGDLVSPFSFPVKKLPGQLKKEERSIRSNALPWFTRKDSIARNAIQAFQAQSIKQKGNVNPRSLQLVRRVYQKGITNDSAYTGKVRIVNGRTVEIIETGTWLNTKSALHFAIDSLKGMPQKEIDFVLGFLRSPLAVPNVSFDSTLTNKALRTDLSRIVPVEGKVSTGELIVAKNAWIDTLTYRKIISYYDKYSGEIRATGHPIIIWAGNLLIFIIFFSLLAILLPGLDIKLRSNGHLGFTFLLCGVFILLTKIPDESISRLLIPYCLVPLLLRSFYNERVALIAHITVIFLSGMLIADNRAFFFTEAVAGTAAVLVPYQSRVMREFVTSVFYIFLAAFITYAGHEMAEKGHLLSSRINESIAVSGFDIKEAGSLAIGIFLLILAYPLVPMLERFVGYTSDITLLEWNDLNSPIMKKLSLEAPGTYQHSLQVSAIAELAARAIGANSLLVKTAALYHDIGKCENATYFVENQHRGNPHDALDPRESARIIINHVKFGEQMAEADDLPEVLTRFISTHHGTTRTNYFYHKYLRDHPDATDAEFRYPGPKPRSREEVILMIADGCEAAARALSNPTPEELDALTHRIVRDKLMDGQFEEAAISLREIEIVRNSITKALESIYHQRIKYPGDRN